MQENNPHWKKYYSECVDVTVPYPGKILQKVNGYEGKKKVAILKKELSPLGEINFSLGEGNTPLYQLFLGEKEPQIYLKDESTNPTGVYKDRETALMIGEALSKNKKAVTIASCGNAASSLAVYAHQANLDCLLFITGGSSPEKINQMLAHSAKIVALKDAIYERVYEKHIDLSDIFEGKGIVNCDPSKNHLQKHGSKTIAYELLTQLNSCPDYVLMPVGNGTLLSGVYYGFKELEQLGLIKKVPQLYAVQIKGGDPITQGFQKQMFTSPTVETNPVHSLCEGIIAEASYEYLAVMDALLKSKGGAISVTDQEVALAYANFVNQEKEIIQKGCIPEPTSAVVLAAVKKIIAEEEWGYDKKVVLISSSHGSKATQDLEELLTSYGFNQEWSTLSPYLSLGGKEETNLLRSENMILVDKDSDYQILSALSKLLG